MLFTPPFKSERDIIQLAKKHKFVRKRYEKRLALQRQQQQKSSKDSQETPSPNENETKDSNMEIPLNDLNSNDSNNANADTAIIAGKDANENESKDTSLEVPLTENNAGDSNSTSIEVNGENTNDIRELISSKKYWFIMIFSGIFLAFYASVESTYGSYLATYSKLEKHESEVTASYLTAAFWGAFCVGRFVSILIAIWVPPEGFFVGSLVLTVVSIVPLVIVPGKITTWVVSVAFGLFIGPIWATVWNIIGKYLVVTGVAGTLLAASSW